MPDRPVKGVRERPPTIRDVARLAGVSTAAAARALHGYGYASPELRAAARAAASELGYEPNRNAQSIKTRRTQTIGVVGADITNPFFSSALRGIADAATASGYQALIANTDENVIKERAAIRALVRHRVDGIVVAPADTNDVEHLAGAIEGGMPMVMLDRDPVELPGDRVIIDSVAAAEHAVSRLLALGHRVGVVAELTGRHDTEILALGPGEPVDVRTLTSSGARLYGYLRAHWGAGRSVDRGLVARAGQYTSASATAAARGLLSLPPAVRPTALFTVDNVVSLGVYEAILESGLVIPDELSMIAFDDVEWMRLVKPRITSVAQPAYEMGVAAAELLHRRIRGEDDPFERRVVPVTILDRGSVAPPKQSAAETLVHGA